MDNKYIKIKTEEYCEVAILFPKIIGHDEMFKTMKLSHPDAEILSAGFWWIDNEGAYRVGGHSVSLNIGPIKKEDEFLINKDFNNGKLVI